MTFFFTCLAWCFFRAESSGQAFAIIKQLFAFDELGVNLALSRVGAFRLILISLVFLREGFFAVGADRLDYFKNGKHENWRVAFLAIVIVLSILFRGPGSSFIYFQF